MRGKSCAKYDDDSKPIVAMRGSKWCAFFPKTANYSFINFDTAGECQAYIDKLIGCTDVHEIDELNRVTLESKPNN